MGDVKYDPSRDIPDLAGKVILVTGGNTGLGKAAIEALAKHNPSKIYLTARDAQKATDAIKDIQKATPHAPLTFLECDLTSLDSVRDAAKSFVSESQRLDILMCNAGIMATPAGLSKDGYEIQFATNHLGHALLIKLLLPTLLKTVEEPNADVRIVSLSSNGAMYSPNGGILFESLRTSQDMTFGGKGARYGQSKLANVLYADELARRYPQLTCTSIHPGIAQTQIIEKPTIWMRAVIHLAARFQQGQILTPEQGAYNQLWAATAPKQDIKNGAFYTPVAQPAKPFKYWPHDELREKLWAWTQKELERYSS